MGVRVLFGRVPGWALSSSGYGSGYGSGDGHGYGYGHGYGDGHGSGYGDGDIERCRPQSTVRVTAERLGDACASQVRVFRGLFPGGATWPDDVYRALDAGLDVSWAASNLGLPPVLTDDVPETAGRVE